MDIQQLGKQFIAGEWRDGQSSRTLNNINPYNDEIITTYKIANVDDIDGAYKAAAKAKLKWDKVNPYKNGIFLKRLFSISKIMKKRLRPLLWTN